MLGCLNFDLFSLEEEYLYPLSLTTHVGEGVPTCYEVVPTCHNHFLFGTHMFRMVINAMIVCILNLTFIPLVCPMTRNSMVVATFLSWKEGSDP